MFDPNKFWKKQILDCSKDWYGKNFKKTQEYKPKYIKGDILTEKCAKDKLVTKDKINPWWTTILGIIQDVDGVKHYVSAHRCSSLDWQEEDKNELDNYEVYLDDEIIEVEDCYCFDRQKYIPYPDSKTEARLKKCLSK